MFPDWFNICLNTHFDQSADSSYEVKEMPVQLQELFNAILAILCHYHEGRITEDELQILLWILLEEKSNSKLG